VKAGKIFTSFSQLFVCTVLMISLWGCYTGKKTTEAMNNWKGTHISEVILQWGPETKITSDGKDGKVYTWEKRWQHYTGEKYIWRYCFRNFYVDSNSIIYSWRWEGWCK
jgi:hypothetical protein